MNPDSGAAGYLLAGGMVSGDTVGIINGGSGTEASEESPTGSAFWDFVLHMHDWDVDMMTCGIIWGCLFALFYTLLYGDIITIVVCFFAISLLAFLLYIVLFVMINERFPNIGRLYKRRNILYA
mgnify:CR=1 FL=1